MGIPRDCIALHCIPVPPSLECRRLFCGGASVASGGGSALGGEGAIGAGRVGRGWPRLRIEFSREKALFEWPLISGPLSGPPRLAPPWPQDGPQQEQA